MKENIIFRESTPEDIPNIIELLKAALGVATKKSLGVWNWKHINNPFGPSEVYIAELNKELIAVRVFMQWQWKKSNGKKMKFLRAVDTCVSAKHRRKGIFENLNKYALEKSKQKGYHAIFNTPNDKSMAGNLKLGWRMNRKISVNLLFNPFFFLTQFFTRKKESTFFKKEYIFENYGDYPSFFTEKSKKFFDWRYYHNPMVEYLFKVFDDEIVFVYRIKKHKFFNECRIVDVFKLKNECNAYVLLKGLAFFSKRYMIVSFAKTLFNKSFLVHNFLVLPTLRLEGPNLVTKNLNLSQHEYELLFDKNPKSWGFHLGDMELF